MTTRRSGTLSIPAGSLSLDDGHYSSTHDLQIILETDDSGYDTLFAAPVSGGSLPTVIPVYDRDPAPRDPFEESPAGTKQRTLHEEGLHLMREKISMLEAELTQKKWQVVELKKENAALEKMNRSLMEKLFGLLDGVFEEFKTKVRAEKSS